MSQFDRVQTFLKSNPDFPQTLFKGVHEINILVPNVKGVYTPEQVDEIVAIACNSEKVQTIVSFVTKSVMTDLGRLLKNTANAEKTRSPQVTTTQKKAFTSALESEEWETAQRMLAITKETAELFGVSDDQVAKMEKELQDAMKTSV